MTRCICAALQGVCPPPADGADVGRRPGCDVDMRTGTVGRGRVMALRNGLTRVADAGQWTPQELVAAAWTRLGHHETTSIGLLRDLRLEQPPPPARRSFTVRPLEHRDVAVLLSPRVDGISERERGERRERLRLLNAGFTGAWVAVDEGDVPCFVQWLIGPSENALLRRYFDGLFPELLPGEALLEGAYTPTTARARVMPFATWCIAQRALDFEAWSVQTWVRADSAASMLACRQAGFRPFAVRTSRWRHLRHDVTFRPYQRTEAVAAP